MVPVQRQRPSQTTPRRRGAKPRRFTHDEVIDAALRVLERDGEAFTMRALADDLGTGAMTLYGYFASRDELFEAIAGRTFEGAGATVPPDAPWQERLRQITRDVHHLAARHPNLAAVFRAESAPNVSLFRTRERILRIICEAGFEGPAALRALGVISGIAQGYAAVQSATDDPMYMPDRLRALPANEFPTLHQHADEYASHVSDDAFEYALDMVLAGLTEELRQKREGSDNDDH
jgi:AcrR family transcriptional regulator